MEAAIRDLEDQLRREKENLQGNALERENALKAEIEKHLQTISSLEGEIERLK